MKKIYVVGIGPGTEADITPAAAAAIGRSSVVIGYKYYLDLIASLIPEGARIVDTGMKREMERAQAAFELAAQGETVCVVSSGDAGIYGMAPLLYEMKARQLSDVQIETVAGISAFQKAATLLGAPMGHDFCVISLSDLMTPWALIEKRIVAAAQADFVTAVYNPRSDARYWELPRLKELFLEQRSGATPVGIVRQAGRSGQSVKITTLEDFEPQQADMFTVIIIGNSRSFVSDGHIITPRGYFSKDTKEPERLGQSIMMESFRTISSELRNPDIPLWKKWPMLHAIHTTADFDMEGRLLVDEDAPCKIYEALTSMEHPVIVTDVSMAAAGIRKGALQRLGVEAVCCLNMPEAAEMARTQGITRSQAGIRIAAARYPHALYAFGNAPTALMELCSLMRRGKATPCGVIGAPVGFVHVCESKHMLKTFSDVAKIIVDGRKGGSNLAATLVNSILCWPDAAELKPGRDV